MAVTEPQRLDLHAAARAALGPEEGDTLMASLPPANTDIATRQDLERVEGSLRQDLERVEGSLRQDLERVEGSLRQDLATVENRMQTYAWKVVVGTAAVLYVATVGTILGAVALLLQVIDLT